MSHSILDLIGNTPLVESKVLNTNPNVKLLFKLEGHNPGGSVKDRPALNMIKSGLERGDITKDSKLIEATSGNTGIALAMISGIYGLDMELVMPENSTKERVQTMRAYGAKVTLTASDIGIEGARDYAE
ncbi:MAG: pyridoxal-phosphate dependent enzyme, partial [Flavobacteriaceae bacterium]